MSDAVTRLNAALEGRYEIERELGEGGMATVYSARDVKHNRSVALKVLKPELAAVVGAERFLAEIETTANLQHPHILPLFDSGEASGFLFYVMPYVEGETLAERIERERQLPVDEALGIATAVAGALQVAHEHGVIHRDIKPANILLSNGQPLVADFGIALAVGAAGGSRLTETGLSVGTPYYMSPEQATGDQSIGPASDTYALACVLYEMLVGEPPYLGNTAQAVLGKIIQGVPVSVTAARRSVPPNVDAAVRKALEKLPADRFRSAGDFARALADPGFRHGEPAGASGGRRGGVIQLAAAVVAGLLLGGAAMALLAGEGDSSPAQVMRFAIELPEDVPLGTLPPTPDLAISRDGSRLVYIGPNPARSNAQLNTRAIDELDAAPLRGADGAVNPFLSPDGAWVGFVDSGSRQTLAKLSILGGPPITLARMPAQIWGASWGADDEIVFSAGVLLRVSGGGGEPEQLTTLDTESGDAGHLWPSIIEGRDAVLFVISQGNPGTDGRLAVLDLRSKEVKELGIAGLAPRYVRTGHLLYLATDASLRAVPFDVRSLEVRGNPVPLVEGVTIKASGAADYDVDDQGRLVYVPGTVSGDGWSLVWVDRDGREDAIDMPARQYDRPRVSPDGRRIAASLPRDNYRDMWVFDAATGAGLRLTRYDDVSQVPIWTPDGRRILFSSTRDAPRPASFEGAQWIGNIYAAPADGSTEPVRVTTTEENQGLTGISPDGRVMVYTRVIDNASHWEVVGAPMDATADGSTLVTGPFRQGSGTISPDGRWLAYRSDETGQFEIYVQAYPGPGAKYAVSVGGGSGPAWSPDGRELFYRDNAGMMVAVSITPGVTPPIGTRTPLFEAGRYVAGGASFRQYDVAPDGRFLMMRAGGDPSGEDAPQIRVVLNWFEELKERVPN